MYPCHRRIDGDSGALYDSQGNICSTWSALSDTNRHLIIAGSAFVGCALLALGIFALVRYVRIRNRRNSNAFVPERPPTAIAQQVFIQHRQTKSMASAPTPTHGRKKSHGPRSRSGSLSSNQTPSPSPLRNAQYTRPQSGYEVERMQYQQPMQNAAYAPISPAAPGDIFADHYNVSSELPRQYSQREEMEYLKDASRRGSMMDFGSNRA